MRESIHIGFRKSKLIKHYIGIALMFVLVFIPKLELNASDLAIVKNNSISKSLSDSGQPANFIESLKKGNYSSLEFFKQVPAFLFIGGMSLMILYFFGIYFMYKDKLFILYSFYLASLLLYLGLRAPILQLLLESNFPNSSYVFNELIQVIVNAFYLQFASVFLKAQSDFPKLHTAIRIVVRLLILIMAIQLILLLSVRYSFLEFYLINFERFFVILFTLGAYYHIIKHYKDRMALFILGGSFFFLTGAVLDWIFDDVLYMMIGSAIEVFVFSLGMGYRVKTIEKEKKTIENEIIAVQLTALKAQMNPHFIFNSLNSIRAYVISNNTKMASDYITKFASLMRLILQYSSQNLISLKDELEALNLYVNLEQMRYREDFGFKINIDETIDINSRKVPPLILQPYVENAIRHGLLAKTGPKKLILSISVDDAYLSFRIKDNGVGRQYSKRIKNPEKVEHISMAMDLTKKRIELSNLSNGNSQSIIVVDLMDGGNQAGTEVILKLPMNRDKHHLTV